jgi:hypothetical protein
MDMNMIRVIAGVSAAGVSGLTITVDLGFSVVGFLSITIGLGSSILIVGRLITLASELSSSSIVGSTRNLFPTFLIVIETGIFSERGNFPDLSL